MRRVRVEKDERRRRRRRSKGALWGFDVTWFQAWSEFTSTLFGIASRVYRFLPVPLPSSPFLSPCDTPTPRKTRARSSPPHPIKQPIHGCHLPLVIPRATEDAGETQDQQAPAREHSHVPLPYSPFSRSHPPLLPPPTPPALRLPSTHSRRLPPPQPLRRDL